MLGAGETGLNYSGFKTCHRLTNTTLGYEPSVQLGTWSNEVQPHLLRGYFYQTIRS